MSPFSLLRLPSLLMIDALKMMDTLEIVRLSLCSEKIRRVITVARKAVSLDILSEEQVEKMDVLETIGLLRLNVQTNSAAFFQKYQISMNVLFHKWLTITIDVINYPIPMTFAIYVDSKEMNNFFERRRIDFFKRRRIDWKLSRDLSIPFVLHEVSKKIMHTFWNSRAEGFKIIAEYLNQILNPSIDIIEFCGQKLHGYVGIRRKLTEWGTGKREFSENVKAIINWVASNQKPVEKCHIKEGELIKDEDYQLIFGKIHPIEMKHRSEKRRKGYVYQGTINATYFELCGKWFTIDNLLDTNCEHIKISETQLNNDDLKKYVDAWMTGRFPKLKVLKVEMEKNVDVSIIISGIFKYEDSHTWRSQEYVHIRRHDGITAMINDRCVKIFMMQVFEN